MITSHLHARKPKAHWAAEVAGWIGAISILLAYILVLNGVIEGEGVWNVLLNLIGAIGILTIGIVKRVAQAMVLNTIWIIVAIIALAKLWLS